MDDRDEQLRGLVAAVTATLMAEAEPSPEEVRAQVEAVADAFLARFDPGVGTRDVDRA